MRNDRSRSRGGIYAAITTIAITAGLGAVGAAGADDAANAHVYARDPSGLCFSNDPASTCPAGEAANVTINVGETVTFHFEDTSLQHNAVGSSPVAWQVPAAGGYLEEGSEAKTFTQPGDYPFVCALHGSMTGIVHVVGADPTQTATPPTPSPSPQPSGPPTITTPPPSGGDDTVKPTVTGIRTKALRRAVRVQFKLSEPATVTVRVKRRGSRKVLKAKRVQALAGTRNVTLRSKRLKKGRYTVEIQARDAYGNRSSLARKSLTLWR